MNSNFVAYVRLGDQRIENCRFESRLSLKTLASTVTLAHLAQLRRIEAAEPMMTLFRTEPTLTIGVSDADPRAFQAVRGGLLIGSAWLDDPMQMKRALMMALLKTEAPYSSSNQFQLEVMTDFLLLAMAGEDLWGRPDGPLYSLRKDVKFPTAAPSFQQYCQSPFRSLAHHKICALPSPDSADLQERVWGFRPLLASALWRVYDKLPIGQKLETLAKIRAEVRLPIIASVYNTGVENLVDWFENTLRDHVMALGMSSTPEGDLAVRRTFKELDVEAPTHWELTVDLTHTPKWREIVEQLKTRSHYRMKERALVFTPEGEFALPSGLPVGWTAGDIQSQKHVMIACKWPSPTDAVHVQARQLFARQTCEKLGAAFWD